MNDFPDHRHTQRITPSQAGMRLDLAIGQAMKLSRQQVRTLLEQGCVSIDGRVVPPAAKGRILQQGQEIMVETPWPCGRWEVTPEPDLPLSVLEQGEGYLLLDKPAGMPVHPLKPGETGTLLNAAIARFPQINNVGEGGLRSGVVHRLDVETSGVVIMATTQQRWEQLRHAFSSHVTKKHYTAIVTGHPPAEKSLKLELQITRHKPAYVSVVEKPSPQSRQCDLSWRVTQRLRDGSVLDIQLGTGFLHQIRVMMNHVGHGVLGDRVYHAHATTAVTDEKRLPPRLMLHAHSLAVGSIHAQSPLPEAMQDAIAQLA